MKYRTAMQVLAFDCETFYIRWAVEAGVDTIEHPLPRTGDILRLMAKRGTASIPNIGVGNGWLIRACNQITAP